MSRTTLPPRKHAETVTPIAVDGSVLTVFVRTAVGLQDLIAVSRALPDVRLRDYLDVRLGRARFEGTTVEGLRVIRERPARAPKGGAA